MKNVQMRNLGTILIKGGCITSWRINVQGEALDVEYETEEREYDRRYRVKVSQNLKQLYKTHKE